VRTAVDDCCGAWLEPVDVDTKKWLRIQAAPDLEAGLLIWRLRNDEEHASVDGVWLDRSGHGDLKALPGRSGHTLGCSAGRDQRDKTNCETASGEHPQDSVSHNGASALREKESGVWCL